MKPRPFSLDNKRYTTFNADLRRRFGEKVLRIPLNTGLSCPNRDGTCGIGGCSFCNAQGSGEFAGNPLDDLMTQYTQGKAMMQRKWPDSTKTIAYFQAYTNTYAPLETLKGFFEPFVAMDEVVALAIATRVDALDEAIITYLELLNQQKPIFLELGLQSIHDTTATHMNRGHTTAQFITMMERLQKTNLLTVIHVMNGYPTETKAMMIETIQAVAKLHPYGVKIHMLNVLKNTKLGRDYQRHPFELLDQNEYENLVIHQLQLLPADIVILRLTGDGEEGEVLAPQWASNKTSVLNGIDKKMARWNVVQGDLA
jgi:radical SAM protein (TIGR01212 family)